MAGVIVPRDNAGRFVRPFCPECGGPLQYDGENQFSRMKEWSCTDLIDPEDENKPLEACPFRFTDGQAFTTKDHP